MPPSPRSAVILNDPTVRPTSDSAGGFAPAPGFGGPAAEVPNAIEERIGFFRRKLERLARADAQRVGTLPGFPASEPRQGKIARGSGKELPLHQVHALARQRVALG